MLLPRIHAGTNEVRAYQLAWSSERGGSLVPAYEQVCYLAYVCAICSGLRQGKDDIFIDIADNGPSEGIQYCWKIMLN